MIRPPIGEPDFQEDEYWPLRKTIYGLRCYPHHWYNMIKGILLKMVLNHSLHDPCLISDTLNNPSSYTGKSQLQYQLHIGLYINDFVFHSSDPDQ